MTLARLTQRVKRFYARGLRPGEEVQQATPGYAARTGTLIMAGAVLGGVIGWLYALYFDAAPLPPVVLGSFAGTIGGYFVAEASARGAGGPGATSFTVLTTTERLLIVRTHNAIRPKILRSYELASIATIASRRYPVANYHRSEIELTTGTKITIISAGELNIDP